MLVSCLRSFACLLPLFAFTMMSLQSFVLADRKFCGPDLADALKLLCRGKYRSKDSTSMKRAESQSVTQTCCLRPCKMTELLTYCAEPSSDNPMEALLRRFKQGKAAAAAAAGQKVADSTESSIATLLHKGSSRMKSLHGKLSVDTSPLLDLRDDAYESLPFRQR